MPAGPSRDDIQAVVFDLDGVLVDSEDTVGRRATRPRRNQWRDHHAIQAIYGVGPTIAGIAVAEIGDVHRFPGPAALWPTPMVSVEPA
jgi:phosphoglycolate phosphatase-like HAD superfamily hydrolase